MARIADTAESSDGMTARRASERRASAVPSVSRIGAVASTVQDKESERGVAPKMMLVFATLLLDTGRIVGSERQGARARRKSKKLKYSRRTFGSVTIAPVLT
jgi:hypothetical protein